MRVLVIGDRIVDQYSFCEAVRLSPEAPAPVLHIQSERTSEGGAALVKDNLKSLLGEENVTGVFGSISHKHRIFAGRFLQCRIDRDRFSVASREGYWRQVLAQLAAHDAVVVGDYGKGAMTENIATGVVAYCNQNQIPLFVDAKADPAPYKGCFALFPNQHEHNGIVISDYIHIIRKLGPIGCSVDAKLVSTEKQHVYDETGAGDVFLAAFVARYIQSEIPDLMDCARYANKAAGISVRHLGTYIVKPDELYEK